MTYENLFPRASVCVPLSKADAEVFVCIANTVNSYGFDWWFADQTACWGRREKGKHKASMRFGRLILHDNQACVTVRIKGNGREVLWETYSTFLESLGIGRDDGRVFIPLAQFEKLFNAAVPTAAEFVQSLYELALPRESVGLWEYDFDKGLSRAGSPERPSVEARRPLLVGCAPGFSEQRMAYVRVGHQAFRRGVVGHWEAQCAVLGEIDCRLLVASHIVPWSKATANEKTDPNNGLLLSSHLDALFDRGLISFDDSGALLVGDLDLVTQKAFGLDNGFMGLREPIRLLTEAMRGYLRRHRQEYGFS